jgi:two-component sensor histidine kinase
MHSRTKRRTRRSSFRTETDWKLTVSDNGIGKQDLSASQKKGGLGTSLVQSLAKQLDARVDTESNSHGTAVTLTHATFKAKPSEAEETVAA